MRFGRDTDYDMLEWEKRWEKDRARIVKMSLPETTELLVLEYAHYLHDTDRPHLVKKKSFIVKDVKGRRHVVRFKSIADIARHPIQPNQIVIEKKNGEFIVTWD